MEDLSSDMFLPLFDLRICNENAPTEMCEVLFHKTDKKRKWQNADYRQSIIKNRRVCYSAKTGKNMVCFKIINCGNIRI